MLEFMRKTQNYPKEHLNNKIRSKQNSKDNYMITKILILLLAAFIITGISPVSAKAATGTKLYDYTSGKNVTDPTIKVTYNGAAIGSSKAPGITVNGIALLPYYDIFKISGIAADCTYNSSKGTIMISKYGITIQMKIGSRKATVNGKAVTLPVAPMKVKYITSGSVRVLVPSRYVSETLGLGYTWYSDKNTVAIVTKSIQLSYEGVSKFEYTGAQGKVTINGKNINLGGMPSIIMNDTALLRAKLVFSDSEIGAEYYYNKSDQTVHLKKDGNELIMTIGSRTAYLNSKPKKMSMAALLVKNYDTGASYVMVPGSFTATSLGYDYTWNNSTRTSVITGQADAGSAADNQEEDPELGDSGNENETSLILNQWQGQDTLYNKSTDVREIKENITGSQGTIYSVAKDYSNLKPNSETFALTATTQFHQVTSSRTGKMITLQAANMNCSDQTYQFYGITSSLVNTITTYSDKDTISTTIEVEVLSENDQFDISLSADKQTLYVTIYLNALITAELDTNSNGDYLILKGIMPVSTAVTNNANYIYIDLTDTTNALGDLNSIITGSKLISQVSIFGTPDKTQIILTLSQECRYSEQHDGNSYTISLLPLKNETEPTGLPEVTDKSKYEIIIPRPDQVTGSMVSDEDFYFHNYFVIYIKGDYTDYFNNNPITNNSEAVNNIAVSLNGSGNTEIKITTSKLQGYVIAADTKNIYVNVGNPKDIYKNIVVLDPGHGGEAMGAQYFGSDEKDVNFKILYTVGKKYFNQDTSKLKVYYTRTTDVDVSLADRAAFAKKVGADLFVSLHMNAAEAAEALGTEVYYSEKNNTAGSLGLTSKQLASLLLPDLLDALGTSSRGVKSANYTVIYKNTVPAVLIELGFLSNSSDYAKLTDESYQKAAADAIYHCLLEVFEAYPTGR